MPSLQGWLLMRAQWLMRDVSVSRLFWWRSPVRPIMLKNYDALTAKAASTEICRLDWGFLFRRLFQLAHFVTEMGELKTPDIHWADNGQKGHAGFCQRIFHSGLNFSKHFFGHQPHPLHFIELLLENPLSCSRYEALKLWGPSDTRFMQFIRFGFHLLPAIMS